MVAYKETLVYLLVSVINNEALIGVVRREPDLYTFDVAKDESATMVMGSDGLFDEYSNQKIHLDERDNAQQFIDDHGGNDAFDDNVTVILAKIKAEV